MRTRAGVAGAKKGTRAPEPVRRPCEDAGRGVERLRSAPHARSRAAGRHGFRADEGIASPLAVASKTGSRRAPGVGASFGGGGA